MFFLEDFVVSIFSSDDSLWSYIYKCLHSFGVYRYISKITIEHTAKHRNREKRKTLCRYLGVHDICESLYSMFIQFIILKSFEAHQIGKNQSDVITLYADLGLTKTPNLQRLRPNILLHKIEIRIIESHLFFSSNIACFFPGINLFKLSYFQLNPLE